jgi:hypothetical protein
MCPPTPKQSAKMIHSRIMMGQDHEVQVAEREGVCLRNACTGSENYAAGVLADSISVAVMRLER